MNPDACQVVDPAATIVAASVLAPEARSPVFDALKYPSLIDYPDRMASVLFVAGCNFNCGFCHNAMLLGRPREGLTWDQLRGLSRRWRGQWADASVVSGGEPTLHGDLPKLVEFLRLEGYSVKLDTNGSNPDMLDTVLPLVDYVAMDLKCPIHEYPEKVGFAGTDRLMRSIDMIRRRARRYEFRTTVIEDWHGESSLRAMGEIVRGAHRWVLQPFIPRVDLPDPQCRRRPRTSWKHLRAAGDILKDYVRTVDIRGG